jgi:hypothetical protein
MKSTTAADLKTVRENGLGDTPDEEIDCGPLGKMRVPGEWIDFLTKYSDMFRTDHSGYWAFGVSLKNDAGTDWLAYEMADDRRPNDETIEAVIDAHEEGKKLPERWFVVDKAFAIRAYVEGAKKWGTCWYDDHDCDASTYDWVVQMAALGEVRYG